MRTVNTNHHRPNYPFLVRALGFKPLLANVTLCSPRNVANTTTPREKQEQLLRKRNQTTEQQQHQRRKRKRVHEKEKKEHVVPPSMSASQRLPTRGHKSLWEGRTQRRTQSRELTGAPNEFSIQLLACEQQTPLGNSRRMPILQIQELRVHRLSLETGSPKQG